MNTEKLDIGSLIKNGLEKNRMTQSELASLLGYKSQSIISEWIHNKKIPPGDELIRLMAILNIFPEASEKYQQLKSNKISKPKFATIEDLENIKKEILKEIVQNQLVSIGK